MKYKFSCLYVKPPAPESSLYKKKIFSFDQSPMKTATL